jgi:methylenetetrahydrofolate reductase (NADPH)
MSSLADHFKGDSPVISFELFPPKTEAGLTAMLENVRDLMNFNPSFFTCTYGAGGSTQGLTLGVLKQVKEITQIPIASHLTCVNSTIEQLEQYLRDAKQVGTDYIMALRGDPPKGNDKFEATSGGLRYANELVELIRQSPLDFGILVAGYPEVHQEAPNAKTDLANLKRKVDAGADVVVTQLFYDNEDFYRFRDDCDAVGIRIPIVPGILPVTNFEQAKKIAGMCKAAIPQSLQDEMTAHEDARSQFEIGVDHARRQTIDLLEHGVPGIHYYVLNKSDAAKELLEGLTFTSQSLKEPS